MQFKIDGKSRTTRECTFPYEHTVDKKTVTSPARLVFYPPTLAEIKGTDAKSAARKAGKVNKDDIAPDGSFWLSVILADRICALPDFLDDKGKPFAITVENLDKLSLVNLRAIYQAMMENSVPKSEPSS